MFGLEKKKQPFLFDLEKEIHESPTKTKELMDKADNRMNNIKTTLRTAKKDKNFDNLGILLNGYSALQKVLKRVPR